VSPGILSLAPMDGVSDSSVRAVLTELGGVDYCVTEFVRVAGEAPPDHVLRRKCPELDHGGRTPSGTPVHMQLLGGHAGRMADTAARAAALGAPAIDLNFGCPAPTVNRHDGGATLLRTPCRVEEVTRAVRAAVPAEVPVSVKIRLGWEDPDDVVVLARAAEAGGASWLTVHGRTRVQGYAPPADWERIGRARESVTIPVVANGDLTSPEDLARCARAAGAERFMLGRGAIARPELFRVARGWEGWWPPARRAGVLERFAAQALARAPDRADGILSRLKMWCRAMAAREPALQTLFEAIKRRTCLDEVRGLLRSFRGRAG
jgi:tRNA-dihydrouridine synthase C